jgi:TatD DNase family protein
VVDTHAHLSICEPPDDELVAAARDSGVRRILTVGLDEASNREAVQAAQAHEEVFASVGRHPNSAVGETGLDYYRDRAPGDEQRRAFEAQIGIARKLGLPLVIHLRDRDDREQVDGAVAEAFSLLDQLADGVAVILHCFSAPSRIGEAAERGWYCSFAGNVTYPKSGALREAAAQLPEELLLVETDAPFLAPQPTRGKPNAPANVVATAQTVAEARETGYEQLERTVEANAARAFGW